MRRLFRQIFQHDTQQQQHSTATGESFGRVRSLGYRSLSTPNLGREHLLSDPQYQHQFPGATIFQHSAAAGSGGGEGSGSGGHRRRRSRGGGGGSGGSFDFLCGGQSLLCSLIADAAATGEATASSAASSTEAADSSSQSQRHSEFLQRARCNDADAVLSYLSRGCAPVDLVQGANCRTALCYAAGNGNRRLAEELLALGAGVNGIGKEVPIVHASEGGHLETVRLLVGCGASVDACDSRGSTPLIKAVDRGHLEVVRLLLGTGRACPDAVSTETCDTNLEEPAGFAGVPDCGPLSALMRATHQLRPDIGQLLLDSDPPASPDLANSLGHTAAHALALTCRLPAAPAARLVHHPPLHWADAARLLLGRHCRVNQRNRCGETPLDRLIACMPATLELAPFKTHAVTAWCEVIGLVVLHGANLANRVNFNHRETTLDRLLRKLLALMECSATSEEFLSLARLLMTVSRLSHKRRQLSTTVAAYVIGHQLGASGPQLGRFFHRLRQELSRPLSLKAAAALRIRAACGDPLVARVRRLPLPGTLVNYVTFGVAEQT